MIDGILLGAVVFFFGASFGAGITFFLLDRMESERKTLHQIIGRYQQALEQSQGIPTEEM
jgi:surfactin synthase thioesterase subunit